MRADLHVHSSASDGTDPPAEVMRRAAAAGLDVVALTDHDTVAGHAEARAAAGPLTLLPGMELSCRMNGRSLHMLAYLFDPDQPGLAAEVARIRDDRVLRARAMVDRLAALGVPVTWEQVAEIAGQAVVGRPHIARAMAASGAIASPREAFTRDWIADGGRAYVGRYALDPFRAIALVRAAGGVTVLAHPRAGRDTSVSDEQVAGLAAASLAGVEVHHPDQSDTERARLLALARDLALVATGGSDDHGSLTGHRLGCETTGADAYEALIARAPAPLPRAPRPLSHPPAPSLLFLPLRLFFPGFPPCTTPLRPSLIFFCSAVSCPGGAFPGHDRFSVMSGALFCGRVPGVP